MVGSWLIPGVNPNNVPVVKKGHGLGNGSIDDVGVSAQAFHDEQVVELVVGLGVVGSHPSSKRGIKTKNKREQQKIVHCELAIIDITSRTLAQQSRLSLTRTVPTCYRIALQRFLGDASHSDRQSKEPVRPSLGRKIGQNPALFP